MNYKVGKYLKNPEQYVGGVDSVAQLAEDLPRILAENQRYAVQKQEKRIDDRNLVANKIMEESLTSLTVQTDKEGKEYQKALDGLEYFNEFYKDDPVMQSYGAIHQARMDRFNNRQETYEKNINGISSAHADIKKGLGSAYQSEELEVLLSDMKSRYYNSEQEFTAGEKTEYGGMIKELDTAIETYRGLMGSGAREDMKYRITLPDEASAEKISAIMKQELKADTTYDFNMDRIDPSKASLDDIIKAGGILKEVQEYQAEPSLANDDEYQATLDQSWAAIQAGDYNTAQKLFNTAQSNKIVSEGQFNDIQRGIDSYYEDNLDFNPDEPESVINPKRIVKPEMMDYGIDLGGTPTTVGTLLGSAEAALSADRLDAAEKLLNRIPKSKLDSIKAGQRALDELHKDATDELNEKWNTTLAELNNLDNKGYDGDLKDMFDKLYDFGENAKGTTSVPLKQEELRKVIPEMLLNGIDLDMAVEYDKSLEGMLGVFSKEQLASQSSQNKLYKLLKEYKGAPKDGNFIESLQKWDKKPKGTVADEIFELLNTIEGKSALEGLDWSGSPLDDDSNEHMLSRINALLDLNEFGKPLENEVAPVMKMIQLMQNP